MEIEGHNHGYTFINVGLAYPSLEKCSDFCLGKIISGLKAITMKRRKIHLSRHINGENTPGLYI